MNQQQRELCGDVARLDVDCAIDGLQDLAGELVEDQRDDRPILDTIIADLLAIKDQLLYAEQTGQIRPQIPPTQRGLGLPELDTPDGRNFSLRSSDDGIDVATVAKRYGGGGHRNAAGFRVSYSQARTMELADDSPETAP